ncbi:enolase C-terminal domain-like protein [Haloarchaeobius sp. TZWSO28]|uniref:enolase C-terminal domain-like protein n=1 Tax=Haloarchaeobius sp. TZWSO28 TaxID=3446119 RepID=UPI003EC10A31
MAIQLVDHEGYIFDMQLRMPFHFANTTVTAIPHLFLAVDVDVSGETHRGVAAEGLSPVWFLKDTVPFDEGVDHMLAVVDHALEVGRDIAADTVFGFWRRLFAEQREWGDGTDHPPLLWSFGASMVERAVIDAYCRATETTFATAIAENTFGIEPGTIYDELDGYEPADLLPAEPLSATAIRHTVGFTDPLVTDDVEATDRLDDGLPQSLVEYVREQGLTHFKIKLSGDADRDADRLERIAAVLDSECDRYAFTLDANEQYGTAREFREQWERMRERDGIDEFLEHLLYVEQPLSRDDAFGAETASTFAEWDGPPLIIDESDGDIDSFGRALSCGYIGTSHKGCKGVFRGVVNACLAEHRRRIDPTGGYVVSGEDLTTVGPVGLNQDLAVMGTIGTAHVERNGHHYFRGLSMFPEGVQRRLLASHDDLYRRHEDGFATVDISDGAVDFDSVVAAPFGYGAAFDLSRFESVEEWADGR